jgi:hypothetical protein
MLDPHGQVETTQARFVPPRRYRRPRCTRHPPARHNNRGDGLGAMLAAAVQQPLLVLFTRTGLEAMLAEQALHLVLHLGLEARRGPLHPADDELCPPGPSHPKALSHYVL